MNYQNIYNKIIQRALSRTLPENCYYEKHHIVPKCLGGNDTKENLVKLTANEHFICHLLLAKIYPKHTGLVRAVMYMCKDHKHQKHNMSRNKVYCKFKQKFSHMHLSKRIKRKCKICDKQMLVVKHLEKTKKYCSKECSIKSHQKFKLGFCKTCNKEIRIIKSRPKVFCSMVCFDKFRSNNIIRKKPVTIKNCLCCKNKLELPPNEKHKKYCSKQCFKKIHEKPKLLKVCLVCKKEFIVHQCYSKLKCCSNVCSGVSKRKDFKKDIITFS